ncbi:DUF1990 family protein [Streptomyces aidingensis]|uniref:Uncharacterized protein, UPF0548 family n=1 Tax=Streptomyces aidingensis TaxID=910347 RepID=A0A1I1ETE1_9ACTN|nr:DUF1990 domain-containing protein [Streptomyces aidingensis]SFB88798.1 Uncharacterized protein, UPF0548 family [Streptomyces aidingensis]
MMSDDGPGDAGRTDTAGFTYPDVGATRSGPAALPPPGHRLLRVCVPLGHGAALAREAGRALMDWRMHRALGVMVAADTPEAEPGSRVVIGLGVGRFRLAAPCRVVWTVREPDRTGWAYGTLPGHPVSGEEAFVVERAPDGTVRLTVTAFSRPVAWWTRAGGPLARAGQRLYARRCGRVLRRLARRAMSG